MKALDLSRKTGWLAGPAIVLLTVLAYLPALGAGFIWDDDDYVTGNPTLHNLAGLRRIWFERGAVPQYYPLVHTTFWIEHHLWGLNALGYHAVNVLLHAVVAVLVWRVLLRLEVPGAWLAATLFALHPVAVESVAWVTERKNVLSAVFYLGSALAWLRFAPIQTGADPPPNPERKKKRQPAASPEPATGDRAGSPAWYLLSLGFFLCALLSKTVACTLPAALLLVSWWKTGRVRWRDVRPLVPFFALGLLLSLNTVWMEASRVGARGPDWAFSMADRVLIAGRALWFYAGKIAWPSLLTFVYPRWQISSAQWWQWLFPAAALALVAALWTWRRRLGRGPLVAVLFFAGTLAPALGFVNVYPMRFTFVADHYQYLATVGLLSLAAVGLLRYAGRYAVVVPLVLAALTWRQTHIYRDLETLWRDTLTKDPSSWLALNNLGNVLLDRGQVDSAIGDYRAAAALKPDNYEALTNLGGALLARGQLINARRDNERALQLEPTYTPALVNLGAIDIRQGQVDAAIASLRAVLDRDPDNADAWNNLGSALSEKQDYADAADYYERALLLNPSSTSARVNLARVLLRTGKVDEAASQLAIALRQSPNDSDTRNEMGQVMVARGQSADAIAWYSDLVRLTPGNASAHFNLGTLLSQAGRNDQAIEQLQAAIDLDPSRAEAHNNLGIAFIIDHRLTDAVDQFEDALRLRTDNPEAHSNLAYVLMQLGRREEAIAHVREALRLKPNYDRALEQLRELEASPRR